MRPQTRNEGFSEMKKINENLLKRFVNSKANKILDFNRLELLHDGKYKNLYYCQRIMENSVGNRGVHNTEINHSAYEEYVRIYLLTKLCNDLGYSPDNIEVERTFRSGSSGSGNDYLDVTIYDENNHNSIFMMIELKKPEDFDSLREDSIQNQLYKLSAMASQETPKKEVKYLVYYTVETEGTSFIERTIIIDTQECPTYQDYLNMKDQGISFNGEIPAQYGIVSKSLYGNVNTPSNELSPLPLTITQKVSQTLAENLHNLLWGGGSGSDNRIFVSLTNLMLVKIYDEENTPSNSPYSFQIYSKKDTVRKIDIAESNEEIYARIDALYKTAAREKLFIEDIESHVIDDELKGKLKQAIELLQMYNFTKTTKNSNGVDILGQFFESIISKGFKQSKGQFFTPVEIVRFIINGLKIDELVEKKFMNYNELPYVIDPSCGSGTFLIEYMKYVTKFLEKYSLNPNSGLSNNKKQLLKNWVDDGTKNYWAKKYIYGSEISAELGTAVKVSMVMHGDGASNIFCGEKKGDGLLPFNRYTKPSGDESKLSVSSSSKYYNNEVNAMFDVIISNPPFSVLLNSETTDLVKRNFDLEYKGGRTKNSEHIFVERFYQLLKPKGRMGIVLPESCFDGSDSISLRMFLFKRFNIRAIVSLPITTFEPFTSTKVSLVFAQKKSNEDLEKWDNEYKKLKESGKTDEIEIFSSLVDKYNCPVKMISVDNIGYKKTKTTYLPKPNELFDKNDINNLLFNSINDEAYAIKDLREICWED